MQRVEVIALCADSFISDRISPLSRSLAGPCDSGVVMLLSSREYASRLVVCLLSLRRWYTGPVTLFVTEDDMLWFGIKFERDNRLDCEVRRIPASLHTSTSAYLLKLQAITMSPYSRTVFLDADMIVCGDISPLFPLSGEQVVVTQFANWVTTSNPVKSRILQWLRLPFDCELSRRISTALEGYCAINTGALGVDLKSFDIEEWLRMALLGRNCTLFEEIALQLLLPDTAHRFLDCRFNCSAVYAPMTSNVRVWHFHGGRHLASPHSRSLWMGGFADCFSGNVADVRSWWRYADPYLERYWHW